MDGLQSTTYVEFFIHRDYTATDLKDVDQIRPQVTGVFLLEGVHDALDIVCRGRQLRDTNFYRRETCEVGARIG